MYHAQSNDPRRRGSALVVSLVVVTLVAALGAGLVGVQSSLTARHDQAIDTKRALYIAEAGLAEAFLAVAVGKSGNVGSAEDPAGWDGGVYWVESAADAGGNIHLKSTGLAGQGRFSLQTVIVPAVNPAADGGVFGQEEVVVGAGAVVDGFDPADGDFDLQLDPTLPGSTTGGGARITSNGEVSLYGDLIPEGSEWVAETRIYGEVRPGPDAVVVSESGVEILGSTLPLAETRETVRIPVPEITRSEGSLTVTGVLSGDYLRYDELHVPAGSSLRVEGPIKVVTDTLQVDGRLELDGASGDVEVFVLSALRFPAGSELETVSPSAGDVGLFLGPLGAEGSDWDSIHASGGYEGSTELESSTDSLLQDFMFEPTGTFRGLLYAPFVDLTVPAGLRVFGAVGARRVELAPDARVTFDEGVSSSSLGLPVLPKLMSWRIVDLPYEDIVRSRLDPSVKLRLEGKTPIPSAQAHEEQNLEMRYVDTGGTPRTFSGPSWLLDWNTVGQVFGVRWEDPDTGDLSGETVPAGLLRADRGFVDLDPADGDSDGDGDNDGDGDDDDDSDDDGDSDGDCD